MEVKQIQTFTLKRDNGFTDRISIVKITSLKLRSCWVGRNISRRSSYLWWSAYGGITEDVAPHVQNIDGYLGGLTKSVTWESGYGH